GVSLTPFVRHWQPAEYHPVVELRRKRSTSRQPPPKQPLRLSFKAHNRVFRLVLQPDPGSVFADDVQFHSTSGPLSYNTALVYSGKLEDDESSHVYGVITAEGLFDGTIWTASEEYYVEPLTRYNFEHPSMHSVIYRRSDVEHPDDNRNASNCASHLLHVKGTIGKHGELFNFTEETPNKNIPFSNKSDDLSTEINRRKKRWLPEDEMQDDQPKKNPELPLDLDVPYTSNSDPFDKSSTRKPKTKIDKSNLITKVRLDMEESRPKPKTHVEVIKTKAGVVTISKDIVKKEPVGYTVLSANASDDGRHVNKRATVDPRKTTCLVYLQADHMFYQRYGSEESCIEVMTRHVQKVNAIYKVTDFNQDGKPDNITFMIKRIKVHTLDALKDPAYRFPNNYGVEKYLELFSEEDYDAFCLAYMFTYRDFEMGTLGLAWTGDLKNAGGVCEKNGHYRGSMKSLNTGIVTLLNYGKHVPPAVSHHDPEVCTPFGEDGNYIMFARATSGDRKNNNKFSPCSLRAIDPGPCCTASCTLKFGDKCRSDNGCRDAAHCDGKRAACPTSRHKPNRTRCDKELVCFMGVASTRLFGRHSKKIKSVTIIHSSTTETVRLPDGPDQMIVHTAVSKKEQSNKHGDKASPSHTTKNGKKRKPATQVIEDNDKVNKEATAVVTNPDGKSPKHVILSKHKGKVTKRKVKVKKETIDYSSMQKHSSSPAKDTEALSKVQKWLLTSPQPAVIPKSKSIPVGLTERNHRQTAKSTRKTRPSKSATNLFSGEKARLQVVFKPPFRFSVKICKSDKTKVVLDKSSKPEVDRKRHEASQLTSVENGKLNINTKCKAIKSTVDNTTNSPVDIAQNKDVPDHGYENMLPRSASDCKLGKVIETKRNGHKKSNSVGHKRETTESRQNLIAQDDLDNAHVYENVLVSQDAFVPKSCSMPRRQTSALISRQSSYGHLPRAQVRPQRHSTNNVNRSRNSSSCDIENFYNIIETLRRNTNEASEGNACNTNTSSSSGSSHELVPRCKSRTRQNSLVDRSSQAKLKRQLSEVELNSKENLKGFQLVVGKEKLKRQLSDNELARSRLQLAMPMSAGAEPKQPFCWNKRASLDCEASIPGTKPSKPRTNSKRTTYTFGELKNTILLMLRFILLQAFVKYFS
ncbi:unnamed protein product, partial [Leptidea sinapis]